MFTSIISDAITLPALLICLITAMVLGSLNAMVFLHKTRHSSGFALTLAIMPMAIAVVIMMVNGNIGTGVAVAGAFALVRFRSIPGSAKEIAAIFTDMAMGLALGMGYIGVAVIFFLFVGAFTLLLTKLGFGALSPAQKQLRITIPEGFDYNGLFDDVFATYCEGAELTKVKTANMGTLFELTYNIRLSEDAIPKAFLDELRARNGNLTIQISDYSEKEML